MKKKIRIFFEPIEKEIEINQNIINDERAVEEELNWNVYTFREEEILNQARIDYWEEV